MFRVSYLGGSWVVISGAICKVTIVITHLRGLITTLITTHEPPSKNPHSTESWVFRGLVLRLVLQYPLVLYLGSFGQKDS